MSWKTLGVALFMMQLAARVVAQTPDYTQKEDKTSPKASANSVVNDGVSAYFRYLADVDVYKTGDEVDYYEYTYGLRNLSSGSSLYVEWLDSGIKGVWLKNSDSKCGYQLQLFDAWDAVKVKTIKYSQQEHEVNAHSFVAKDDGEENPPKASRIKLKSRLYYTDDSETYDIEFETYMSEDRNFVLETNLVAQDKGDPEKCYIEIEPLSKILSRPQERIVIVKEWTRPIHLDEKVLCEVRLKVKNDLAYSLGQEQKYKAVPATVNLYISPLEEPIASGKISVYLPVEEQ